jgi:hypothetical protein
MTLDKAPMTAVLLTAVVTAACTSQWGPLAVARAESGDLARAEGTLLLTAKCAFIEQSGERMILVWPVDRTTWNPTTGEVSFRRLRGEMVAIRSGQKVVLGGGAAGIEGLSTDDWAGRFDWVAPPDPGCVTDSRWFVSDVEPG